MTSLNRNGIISKEALDKLQKITSTEMDWRDWFENQSPAQKQEWINNLRDAPLVGPQPGPQTMAFNSDADIIGYGGSAGGGKSALIALKALLSHTRTVIFRKDAQQLRALVDDLIQFVGTDTGLNRAHSSFYLGDRPGHMIEWGGIGDPGSEQKWRGRAHDLMCIDEATEVQEKKIKFLMAWCRTHLQSQRCCVIMTFNPPGGPDDPSGGQGRWVIDYFAPWLDERHPNPAKSGEIRYFGTNENGDEIECEDNTPYEIELNKEIITVKPRSRTFIFSRVWDNEYLKNTNYVQTLLSLEEPHRSRMLLGDFRSGIIDHEDQLIPTGWVDEAMDRWREAEKNMRIPELKRKQMGSIGVDVARGGLDYTILARRHGFFWDKLISVKGGQTPDGSKVAALCTQHVRDGATICIDANGVGASPYDLLKQAGANVEGIMGQKTKGLPNLPNTEKCANLRTALWWMLRKILDPDNNFMPLIPPDNRLRSELIAPLFSQNANKIVIDTKRQVKERLGFSPDMGDALAYSLYNIDDVEERCAERLQGLPVNVGDDFYKRHLAYFNEHDWMMN